MPQPGMCPKHPESKKLKDLNTSDLLFLNCFAHFHFHRLNSRLCEPLIFNISYVPAGNSSSWGKFSPSHQQPNQDTRHCCRGLEQKDFWEHGGQYKHSTVNRSGNVVNPACVVPRCIPRLPELLVADEAQTPLFSPEQNP